MDWKKVVSDLMARGWRQVELAQLAGCKQATISELRSGAVKEPRYGVGRALMAIHESGVKPKVAA